MKLSELSKMIQDFTDAHGDSDFDVVFVGGDEDCSPLIYTVLDRNSIEESPMDQRAKVVFEVDQ